MKKNVKLANFDDPKWTYDDLKRYARKYRRQLNDAVNVPMNIYNALSMYQCLPKETLIEKLKMVQAFLY